MCIPIPGGQIVVVFVFFSVLSIIHTEPFQRQTVKECFFFSLSYNALIMSIIVNIKGVLEKNVSGHKSATHKAVFHLKVTSRLSILGINSHLPASARQLLALALWDIF